MFLVTRKSVILGFPIKLDKNLSKTKTGQLSWLGSYFYAYSASSDQTAQQCKLVSLIFVCRLKTAVFVVRDRKINVLKACHVLRQALPAVCVLFSHKLPHLVTEPRHERYEFLPMRKQRGRSAVQ